MACQHVSVAWYLAHNEDGWRCLDCDATLGFRPDLDRREVVTKVDGILHDLHDHGFVYVSNGTQGDFVCVSVAKRCETTNRHDQASIIEFILQDADMGGWTYWQKRARTWLDNGGCIPEDQRMRELGMPELLGGVR